MYKYLYCCICRDISSIEKLQVCGRKFQHVQEEMSDKLLKKIKEYDKLVL